MLCNNHSEISESECCAKMHSNETDTMIKTSKPRLHTVEMYASAIVAFTHMYT